MIVFLKYIYFRKSKNKKKSNKLQEKADGVGQDSSPTLTMASQSGSTYFWRPKSRIDKNETRWTCLFCHP